MKSESNNTVFTNELVLLLSFIIIILGMIFIKTKLYISLPLAFFCFMSIAFAIANRNDRKIYKITFSLLSPFGLLAAYFWILYLCADFNLFIPKIKKTYILFLIVFFVLDLIYCKIIPEKINYKPLTLHSTTNDSFAINNDTDVYFESAAQLFIQQKRASVGLLQRTYKIGFNRAAKIMDQLCEAGVISLENGSNTRTVLMNETEFFKALERWEQNTSSMQSTIGPQGVQEQSSIEKIKWYNNKFDYMTGNDFEQFCALVLQGNGYTTRVTPTSGDFGVDIIAEQSGITYAIQCKCYSSDIGVDAVYQVAGGMKYYHANLGIVLTNRYFTRQAQELASGIGVVLWDRDSLIKLIHTSGLNDSSELADIEEVASETDDLATITAYKAGDPECQPSISQEDLLKELEHDDA
ncbi:restriction endonuclease [Blautia glucerasea]|jgi:HJR/Mrr/RecB family endonuclease|uniref:restriction endonuclease n=1 Tax=Clostridia TaxID=186801 RepID=UPI00189D8604|nr:MULTISPECIES: restriction endonuclease [Clostridia]MCB5384560.1 restriction endonuclease [Blautia glucerasea]MCB5482380.1 restriction endonuclease [Blautia faecis]MDB8771837.1 restriction endonuclease [Ruminococcus sp. 1001136sp1]MDB8783054.1 restriction endonuclease [Ruminococcus sp. 1001136sp1]